jgi:Flp pilus assembly protein TadG
MRRLFQHTRARVRQFRRREDGIAAVEFALILPFMLIVYIGSVEITGLISMDRKLQSVSGAVGDLVARSKAAIPPETLEDYFQAAAGIMTPFAAETLTQIVTFVRVDADGAATVVWSRQYKDGELTVSNKHVANTPFQTLPQAMINVALDNFVVVAEGSYAYTPSYGFAFDHTINLYRENFFMPRFRDMITTQ